VKVTDWTRRTLAIRRERRDYERAGWERVPGPWDLDRGGRQSCQITEAEVSVDGKNIWVKVSKK
jgi:hypothetical protein